MQQGQLVCRSYTWLLRKLTQRDLYKCVGPARLSERILRHVDGHVSNVAHGIVCEQAESSKDLRSPHCFKIATNALLQAVILVVLPIADVRRTAPAAVAR